MTHEEFRQKQLDTRVNKDIATILELVKEEAKPDFLPSIDLSKLVAFGYSMGGMTSVDMCHKFPDEFKLCIAMDIYFKGRYQEIMEGSDYALTQPLCITTTGSFHVMGYDDNPLINYKEGFDCEKVKNKFFEDTVKKNKSKINYNVVVNDCSHVSISDGALFLFRDYIFKGVISGKSNPRDKLYQFVEMNIAFLAEHGFLPVKFDRKVPEIAAKEFPM